ncbi:uracil-DNA glycosylase family protein [Acholeplasma granularum]|uniref:uracil-DNA glycosylase family protein n=1 Tax=Acholeplasma granularum TaxID=264635 RepID=UPI0004BB6418|nr:uracil-DNA glycosylase family protein [Acholeplasma granularum]
MKSKDKLKEIRLDIINDPEQKDYTNMGWLPLYQVSSKSKIIIVGQAPGLKTQNKNVAWQDKSGNRLRSWLGVDESNFYDTSNFAQLPMDFYYPGKGKTGDLPPRKGFAQKWHPKILNELKNVKLIILIGNYAQKYYLGNLSKKNLTENIKNYQLFLPKFFVLPHPSPLNLRWFIKNPWFEQEVLLELKSYVHKILNEKN